MNLKDHLEKLTDEEISEMLEDLADLQERRQRGKKKEEDHYYEFTGTWSWGIWAKNQQEAEEYFKNAYIEDFEVLTDEYEMKKYDRKEIFTRLG